MQQKCGDNKVYARRQKKKKKKKLPEICTFAWAMSGIKCAFTFASNCVDTHFVPRQRPPRKKASSQQLPIMGHVRAWHQYPLCSCNATTKRRIIYIAIKINILCPCARLNCRFRVFSATQIDFVCNLTAHDCHMWHAPGCQQTQAQTERALK